MGSSSDEDIRKKGNWLLVNQRGSVENSDEDSSRSKASSLTNVASTSGGAVSGSVLDKDEPQLDPLQIVPDDSPSLASSGSLSSSGSTLVSGLPSPQQDQETTPPLGRVEEDLSCVSSILGGKMEKEDSHSLDSFEVLSEGPSVEGGLSLDGRSEEDMYDEEDDDNSPEFPGARGVPPKFASDSDSDFVRLSEPTESAQSGVEEVNAGPQTHDPDSSSPESDHADSHRVPYGGSSSSGEDSEASPIMPPRPQNAPYQDVRDCPSEEESDHVRIMSRRWPTEDGGFLLVQRFKKLDPDSVSMISSSMSDVSGFSMLGGSSHHGMLSDTHEEEEGREESDTESEASDSSFASEETLPVNMTIRNLPPALRQYLHQRNDVINSKLNLLAILVLTAGLTLGIGHFVGSSQMVSHHKSLQEGQKLRLRSLQDELVSCMERRRATAKQLQERDSDYQECNRARDAVLLSLSGPEGPREVGPPAECVDSVNAKACNQCRDGGLRYSKFCNTLCPVGDENGHSWANVEGLGLGSWVSETGGNGKSMIIDGVADIEQVAPSLGGMLPGHVRTSRGEAGDHHAVNNVPDDGSVPVVGYGIIPEQPQNRDASIEATEEETPEKNQARVISESLEEKAMTLEDDQTRDIPPVAAEETSALTGHHIGVVSADDAERATGKESLDARVGIDPLPDQAEDKWVCVYHDHGTLECLEWVPVDGEVTAWPKQLDGGHPGETEPSTMKVHLIDTDRYSMESALQHREEDMEMGTNPEIPLQNLDAENPEKVEQDPSGGDSDEGTNSELAQRTWDMQEDEVKWVCVDGSVEDCLEWIPKSSIPGTASNSTLTGSEESETSSGTEKIHLEGEVPVGNSYNEGVPSESDAAALVEGALLSAWSVFKDMSHKVFHENVSLSIESAFQSAMGVVSNASQHLLQDSVSIQNVTDVMADVKKHVNDLREMLESSLASAQSTAAEGFKEHIQPALEEVGKLMDRRKCGGRRKRNSHGKGRRGSGKNGKPKQISIRKGGSTNQNLGVKKSRQEDLFTRKNIRNGRVHKKTGMVRSTKRKITNRESVSKRNSKSFRTQNVRTPRSKEGEISEQMSERKDGNGKLGMDRFTNPKNVVQKPDLNGSTKPSRASGVEALDSKREKVDMSGKIVLPPQSENMTSVGRRTPEKSAVVSREKKKETVGELGKIGNDAENNTNNGAGRKTTVDRAGTFPEADKNGTSAESERAAKMDKKTTTNPPKLNIERILGSLDMSCRGEVRCVENHKMDAARLLREMIGYRQWLWEQRFRKDVDEVEDFMEELEEFIDEDEIDDEDIEDLKEEFEDMMEDIQKTTKRFFRKQTKKKDGRGEKEQKKGKNRGRADQGKHSQPEREEEPQRGPWMKPQPEVGKSRGGAKDGEKTRPRNKGERQQRNLGSKAPGRSDVQNVKKDDEGEVRTIMLNVQDLPGRLSGNSSLAQESDGETDNGGEPFEAISSSAADGGKNRKPSKEEQSSTSYSNTDQWFFRRARDRDLRRGRDPDGAGWYFKRFKVWEDDRMRREKKDWYFERADSREDERGCTTQPSHCAWAGDESVVTVWETYKWLTERFSMRENLRSWDLEDQIDWFLRKKM